MSEALTSGTLVPRDRKLPGIHGLRAVAALAVIVPHVTYALGLERAVSPWIWQFTGFTAFGVHLFFVLSAFSLFHSTHQTAAGFKEYGIKRFFRIAPLFYAVLLFQQLRDGPLSLAKNVVNLTFIFGIVHGAFASGVSGGWSVGVEMTFYAVLPLIFLMCKTRKDYVFLAIIGTIASWAAYRYVYDADPVTAQAMTGSVPFFTFPGNFVTFCYGLLAYAAFREVKDVKRATQVVAWLTAFAIVLMLVTPLGGETRTPDRPGAMLIFVIFALVTIWQALKPSWLMSNALMQYIGERSFSTYLVQFAVVHAMGPLYHWMASVIHLPSSLMLLVFYVATTIPVILVASLTYRFIEVPGVNIGRRIIKAGRTGQVAMAPAE